MPRSTEGTPVVQFRVGALAPTLAARGDELSLVAKRDLGRYYDVLDAELAEVAATLTVAEALALADACNGWLASEPFDYRALRLQVADALALSGLAERYGIDGDRLLALIDGMTPTQQLGVLDAAERVWRAADDADDPAALVVAVGLARREG